MSLCDRCFAPGACCKSLGLIKDGQEVTTWAGDGEAEKQMADFGLPFAPVEITSRWTVTDEADPNHGREYVVHRWACPRLKPDGRCGDYENRPDLCRSFEPGADPLCVHYRGAEGGDPTLGFEPAFL